jgi:predicted permease
MLKNSESKEMKKSAIRKIVVPAMLPILFLNMWVFSKLSDALDGMLPLLGIYLAITLMPTILGMWYGWELKKEFTNEQN